MVRRAPACHGLTRQAGAPRMRTHFPGAVHKVRAPARVTLAADQWTIASTSDLSVRTDIPCDGSKLNAHLALSQYLAAHPHETDGLQVVLTQEAA